MARDIEKTLNWEVIAESRKYGTLAQMDGGGNKKLTDEQYFRRLDQARISKINEREGDA